MEKSQKIIIHGSEDSLDKDVYVLIDSPMDKKQAKPICDSYKEINANLIYIENNQVKWVYKGTTDEVQNSILATFHLHEENSGFDCPIVEKAKRFHGFKAIRTIRGLLSTASRTQYREIVKKAMVAPTIDEKLQCLESIKIQDITEFGKNDKIESLKFYAFQLGQTLSLIKDDEELFTKSQVASKYPQLEVFLYRRETQDVSPIDTMMQEFVQFCKTMFIKTPVPFQAIYKYRSGELEHLDLKNETMQKDVVEVYGNGALFDESHRAYLRENKQWEEYFSKVDEDPIIPVIADLAKIKKEEGYELWIVSGRHISCLDKTKAALAQHGIKYDNIKLRGEGNFVPDYVIKPSWCEKLIGVSRIKEIYEDQNKVIEGFAKKGITAIDVKPIIAESLNKKKKPT